MCPEGKLLWRVPLDQMKDMFRTMGKKRPRSFDAKEFLQQEVVNN